MAMSNEEALGGKSKVKPSAANSQPVSSSHECEALGGMAKKSVPPAHVGYRSTSHHEDALGGHPKKRMVANMDSVQRDEK